MWYEDWFGSDAYELVYRARDEREAEAVIDLVVRTVRPAAGVAVLDVGCGRGRHARSLARRGFRVTGLDLSAAVVEAARRRTAGAGLDDDHNARLDTHLDVRYVQGDMREAVCRACFDGAVNLFTAFGYFEAEADHLRALQAVAVALRPGGWFFLDFLNAPRVAATLVPDDTRRQGDVTIRQRRWIADDRINKEIVLRQGDTERRFYESVRLLTHADFEALFAAAGLDLVETFGDYDGHPYTPTSPRLILYGRKPK